MKELNRYVIPTTAKSPFDFKQFKQDWDKDGGKWRLIITPQDGNGVRRGKLFTRHSPPVLGRVNIDIVRIRINKDLLHSLARDGEFMIAEFNGSRTSILRQAKEKIAEVEAALERKKYVLVYGDF